MTERPAFTTNHADIDAALEAFIDLLPVGCRELLPAIEDAYVAMATAADQEAAHRHLMQTLKPLQALMTAAQQSAQRGRP